MSEKEIPVSSKSQSFDITSLPLELRQILISKLLKGFVMSLICFVLYAIFFWALYKGLHIFVGENVALVIWSLTFLFVGWKIFIQYRISHYGSTFFFIFLLNFKF